jgi:cytoskeletal protein CcmA (bactofilin family)
VFRKKPEPEETVAPSRRFTDEVEALETVIGANTRLKGSLQAKKNVEVQGTLQGNCRIDGLLWIRPGGTVKGDVSATNVVVEGQIQGNIQAKKRVELRSGCTMKGDIEASSVAIAEGSFFEGKVNMRSLDDTQPVTFEGKRESDPRRGNKAEGKD